MIKKEFEQVAHTADLKVRVYGKTKEELFVHALRAMFLSSKPIMAFKDGVELTCAIAPIVHEVSLCAADQEALLVDFLSYALSHAAINHHVYFDAIIHQLTDCCVKASLCGAPISGLAAAEIKAVTYHDLAIIYCDGYWQTYIVFDI